MFALDVVSGEILRKAKIQAPGFVAGWQNQHPALLLDHGMIYIGFANWGMEVSHEYHGWVLRYDAQTLQFRGSFNASPEFKPICKSQMNPENGTMEIKCDCTGGCAGAGVWHGGGGIAGDDDGNVYLMTGNGEYNPATLQFGDSFIKLGGQDDHWGVLQHYAPPEAKGLLPPDLYRCDLDLSAGGPLLIPGSDVLVGGGKTGVLYALKRSNLQLAQPAFRGGTDTYHLPPRDDVCYWEGGPHLHGSPAYWERQRAEYVYIWAEQDYLTRFRVASDGTLDAAPVKGSVRGPECADNKGVGPPTKKEMCPMPGGMLSISADRHASGIVWATLPINSSEPYYTAGRPPAGQLLAYDAEKMVLLWSQNYLDSLSGNRDLPSLLGKWAPPTIADGKVFIATHPVGDDKPGGFLVYELGAEGR